jgi:hypothetical protein
MYSPVHTFTCKSGIRSTGQQHLKAKAILNFDFDPDEIVQQPGEGGPLTLRDAMERLPKGDVSATVMLIRERGKQPPFFDASQIEILRSLLPKYHQD